MPIAGHQYYFTLPARDLARAKAFYGGLFGWEFEATGHITSLAEPHGGISAPSEATYPTIYLHVDDVQAAVERVRSLAGTSSEVQESPSGWWAECIDDQGAHFSIGKMRPGFEG